MLTTIYRKMVNTYKKRSRVGQLIFSLAVIFIILLSLHRSTQPTLPFDVISVHDQIFQVAWNSTGTYIAIATYNEISIWSVFTKARTFATYNDEYISYMIWGPDDSLLAIVNAKGQIKVWETASGNLVNTLNIGDDTWDNPGQTLNFLSANEILYFSSSISEGAYQVWEISSGDRIVNLDMVAIALDILRDKILLATVDDKIWVVDHQQLTQPRFIVEHIGQINDVAWSPSGKYIASCGRDKNIHIWDIDRSTLVKTLTLDNEPTGVFWNPANDMLAIQTLTPDNERAVYVWQVSGQSSAEFVVSSRDRDYPERKALMWSPNGEYLGVLLKPQELPLGDDEYLFPPTWPNDQLLIWNIDAKRPERLINIPAVLRSWAWKPDSSQVAVTNLGDKVLIFDV
ncbi:MAG: hypothetical protein JNJ61_14040 [Anaerolineae bacterium]|nr:hypothetical protein [Anaerolineae bacterium]